jgi:hypothetical protein
MRFRSGAKNGGGLSFATGTDVSRIDVVADANTNDGAVFSMTGALHVVRSSFSDAVNGGGLSFSTPMQVTFEQVSADGNQDDRATFSVAAGTVIFQPFLIAPTAQSAFCQQHGAPVLQGYGLALLLLGLLILPYWRLARRAAPSHR